MKKIDLLIFDLDGTLIDSKKDLANGVNYALESVGISRILESEIYKCIGHGARRMLADTMGNNNPEKVDKALNIFLEYYRQHLLDYTVLYSGVNEMLDYYRNKKKAVVTNKSRKFSEDILRGLNVLDKFDILFGHEDVAKPKPDPMPLIKVMEQLEILPAKTVMVGDCVPDIVAARAAGVTSCAVGYGLSDRKELLNENPDYFVETIDELKNLFE